MTLAERLGVWVLVKALILQSQVPALAFISLKDDPSLEILMLSRMEFVRVLLHDPLRYNHR